MSKNVLFITADQWRGACLSSLAHPVVKTPNLDRLAKAGVTFTQHYAQATPCSPSRASIHTGMYQMNHRVCSNGTPLNKRFTNTALEARKRGYTPMLFGYTDTALDPRDLAENDPARTTYETVLPGYAVGTQLNEKPLPWMSWLEQQQVEIPSFNQANDIYKPTADYPDAQQRGATYPPARYSAEQTETAFLREKVQDYIRQCGDNPWFIHLSWLRPHPPFVVPEPYNSLYHPDEVDMPQRQTSIEAEMAQHPYLDYYLKQKLAEPLPYNVRDGKGLKPDMPEFELRQLRATYYGMISEVDDQFGKLYDFLEAQGQLDNTLIVFSSDHGEQLGDHYLLDKQGFYDQSYHIPLIIHAPGSEWDATRGSQVSQFSENIDIMPTILDLIGADIPEQCDGFSLRPLLSGDSQAPWRSSVHWEHDFRDVAAGKPEKALGLNLDECQLAVIRDTRYKYVHFNQLPALLFDLTADPGELNNLAGKPEYAAIELEYAQKMLNWRMRNSDRLLTGWLYHDCGPSYRPVAERGDLRR